VAGADEVGRGALAGPVSVGMVVVDTAGAKHLKGVRDSKLLAPADRELLVPRIRSWAAAWAVGHATAAEIDELGLTAALRLAGTRAWLQVAAVVRPDIVILDGNHNWLSPAQATLFDAAGDGGC
ncbi:ribonuclease HII, partial [Arthrobacter deserti]|nr:ribonuclease HII [Arthrobacter deserti]